MDDLENVEPVAPVNHKTVDSDQDRDCVALP